MGTEDKAIRSIEKRLMTEERYSVYIAFDNGDSEFFWSEKEVKQFDGLWKRKVPISEIAEIMDRTEISVFLLSLDRLFKKKIKARDWRIW